MQVRRPGIRALLGLLLFTLAGARPAAAQQRYILQTTGGASSILTFCSMAGCQVQNGLDGPQASTFLVTSSSSLVGSSLNYLLVLVAQALGIVSIETDQVLTLPQFPLATIPQGLYDTAPVEYYGTIAWHGYTAQPAAQIIRLTDAQMGFSVSGAGIVAVIDTGVDTAHPVLYPVLLPGYDFTRNQPGASEWLDVPALPNGLTTDGSQQQPGYVQQSTAAVLDQSTAAVLDGRDYTAFGHGTMTCGLVHLVAPGARILPLKAFSSDGTGYLSNIVAALYYAAQNQAGIVNMSFDLPANSPALSKAVNYAHHAGLILVAAAGNENTGAPVYPAAFDGQVMGIASTTDWDTRSSFSNFGNADVWVAAPGEYVISTYPGGAFGSASGTSFSAPLAAGTVALLQSAKPGIDQPSAAAALAHAQLLTPDLNHGRLDVFQALISWTTN